MVDLHHGTTESILLCMRLTLPLVDLFVEGALLLEVPIAPFGSYVQWGLSQTEDACHVAAWVDIRG
jgi:hypothetical protein